MNPPIVLKEMEQIQNDAMVFKTGFVWTTQIIDSYPSKRSWASLQVWESAHIPTNCIQNRWWMRLNSTYLCTETLWQMIYCKIPKILRCIYRLLYTYSATKLESHKALKCSKTLSTTGYKNSTLFWLNMNYKDTSNNQKLTTENGKALITSTIVSA